MSGLRVASAAWFGGDDAVEVLARHLAATAAREGVRAVLGVGGGRVLDVAKGAALAAELPFAALPTSPATCAATAATVVRYDEPGAHAALHGEKVGFGTLVQLRVAGLDGRADDVARVAAFREEATRYAELGVEGLLAAVREVDAWVRGA